MRFAAEQDDETGSGQLGAPAAAAGSSRVGLPCCYATTPAPSHSSFYLIFKDCLFMYTLFNILATTLMVQEQMLEVFCVGEVMYREVCEHCTGSSVYTEPALEPVFEGGE